MRYHPQTDVDVQNMLAAIGAASIDDLFGAIPEALRLNRLLDLPAALGEQALTAHMQALAARNGAASMSASFLGAGMYEHFVPSVVDHILLRGEYLTSYTPYQAEMAQGTLKVIFEFQTLVTEILGLDVANASMYDGAHSAAESLLMALRAFPKAKRVLVSQAVHPEYQRVAQTYFQHRPGVLHALPIRDGVTDLDALRALDLSDVAIVQVQNPNVFGLIEDVEALAEVCRSKGTRLAVCFNEPLAYALVASPGEAGADMAAGEGQPLGVAPGFGGPALGLFACKESYLRQMPGRLVARTTDIEGRDGYVLTLSTREQHIRREKATSNVCTNQGLMALAATIYLSLLGKEGYRQLAELNFARAHYAHDRLCGLPGVRPTFDGQPFFNEFSVTLPCEAARVVAYAAKQGFAAGLDLGRFEAARNQQLLVAVTEMTNREQIDGLVAVVGEAIKNPSQTL
jgi:glycine dehydrogenase subunit 1